MKTITTFFLIFLLKLSHAQIQENETTFTYTDRITKKLQELEKLNPEDYFQKADTYREMIEKYMAHKKRVCDGEFSTVVILEQNAQVLDKASERRSQLSKDEKRLCYRELKAIQSTFINNMYMARKKYLDYLHDTRINELSKAREEAIKSLNATFDKNI